MGASRAAEGGDSIELRGGSPKLEKGCPFSRAPNGAGAGAVWFIYLGYLDEMAFICRESWFQTLDGGVGGVRTRS